MEEVREALLSYLRSQGVPSGQFAVDRDLQQELSRTGSGDTLATRDDVDRYERQAFRSGWRGKVLLACVLLGVAGAGFAIKERLDAEHVAKPEETEPNGEPATASLISVGAPIRGFIGAGNDGAADDDVFRLELTDEDARVANILVTAVPGIDLALDVVARGSSVPVLSVNSGGAGEPEAIPNLTLHEPTYFLRVREVAPPGKPAGANPRDPYTLTVSMSPQVAGFERELNDAYELASTLVPGEKQRGYLGWNRDRDVYCAAPGEAAQTIAVSGIEGVDVVLQYLDRRSEAGQRIDHHGVGEGERLELPASKVERASCVTVSAREHDGARLANPTQAYEIELLRE